MYRKQSSIRRARYCPRFQASLGIIPGVTCLLRIGEESVNFSWFGTSGVVRGGGKQSGTEIEKKCHENRT